MNRDEALSKIKKCLALGRSAEPHEAAAAMRQAQKLMEQHGLSEHDVALADVSTDARKTAMKSMPQWETMLANLVARTFGCDVVWIRNQLFLHGALFPARGLQVLFIGVGAAPAVAGYAWEVLDRQCAKQRLAHIQRQPKSCKPITLTARGDAFAEAWVYGATRQLQAFAGEKHQELIDTYKERTFPELTSSKSKSRAVGRNVKDQDRQAGYEAGQRARLERGIGASEQRLLA